MPLKNKYLKYHPEITLEIFTLVWNKLISYGWECYTTDVEINREYIYFSGDFSYLHNVLPPDVKQFQVRDSILKDKSYSETTVQEILGYDPFVKDEFNLEKDWQIKTTPEVIKELQKHNILFGYNYNYSKYAYYGMFNGIRFGDMDMKENVQVITFEQFKKYVLKSDVETKVESKIPEYVECIEVPKGWINTSVGQIFKTDSVGFSNGYYRILTKNGGQNTNGVQGNFKPSNEAAYLEQNQPKQPLKQAVHCTTQEEWDFVTEKLGYKWSLRAGFDMLKQNSCIELNEPIYGSVQGYKSNQILSFQEWYQQNGYEMKSNQGFKVGDWVIIESSGYGACDNDTGLICKITKTNAKGYLPGYSIEIDRPKKGNKGDKTLDPLCLRHATPEEINEHLISIGQIPAGEPLNTGIEPNKDGIFKYTTGNCYNKDFSTSYIPIDPISAIEFNYLPEPK